MMCRNLRKGPVGPPAVGALLRHKLHGGVDRHAASTGRVYKLVDSLLPYAPGRHVDYPTKAHLIVWVVDDSQICDNVLDLLALVEAQPTDELVRDAVPQAHFLERA